MTITERMVEDILFEKHENAIRLEYDEDRTLKDFVEQIEKSLIAKYIDECDTHEEIEQTLGISKATLNRKIAKYGLRKTPPAQD